MKRYLLPLVVFVVLLGFLAVGLNLKPREVPSPLIDKPAPAFSLPRLDTPDKQLSLQDMQRQGLAAQRLGLVVRGLPRGAPAAGRPGGHRRGADLRPELQGQARRRAGLAGAYGNPYVASLSDTEGLVGIDYGVYGVPETFVIDKTGIIRLKHIGPVTPEVLRDTILPLVKKLNA